MLKNKIYVRETVIQYVNIISPVRTCQPLQCCDDSVVLKKKKNSLATLFTCNGIRLVIPLKRDFFKIMFSIATRNQQGVLKQDKVNKRELVKAVEDLAFTR